MCAVCAVCVVVPDREKQTEYKWQDTNLALFGSDIEKKIKEASAQGEHAWHGCGKRPELRVWRIEAFKVVHWSKVGYFHVGDSYIVLHSYYKSPGSDALAYDVFFWIGSESSQDEYATAAYKTVELDHFLHDAAIQHREVQEHESRRFLSLFEKTGLTYLKGGVASGFNHVEEEQFEPRLYQIKGIKGALVLHEVERRRDHMNSGDVFVLDLGPDNAIYQWNGKQCNAQEKLKAKQLIEGIVSGRSGRCKAITLDEDQGDKGVSEFWDHIPGEGFKVLGLALRKYNVKGELEGGEDDQVDAFRMELYRLSDQSGAMKFVRKERAVKGGRANKRRLESSNTMILDDGFQLYCWIGKGASSAERGLAMSYAMRYIKDKKRPAFMPITAMSEGKESQQFLEKFEDRPVGCFGFM